MSDINMDIDIQAGADLNINVDFQQGETPEINIETAPPGPKGDKGDPGVDGIPATHRWNGTTLTVTSASGTSSADLKGDKGDPGSPGLSGVGIESIDQTVVGLGGGAANTWEILLTDGRREKITLYNGENGIPGKTGAQGPKGETGAKGDKGDPGADGKTPVRGIDYWTTADKAETESFAMEKVAEGIDSLRIGGRNFLIGTGVPYVCVGNPDAKITAFPYLCSNIHNATHLYGKTVTLSFDYEANVTTGYMYMGFNNVWQEIYRFYPEDNSGHIELTITLKVPDVIDLKTIYVQGTWGGTVTLSNLKLEIGNKATDWSPAFEDEPQYELIQSVTLSEEVSEVVFDGFELKAATAFFTLEASTAADGYVSFKPSVSKAGINGTVTNMRRTEKRYSRAAFENKNGLSYAYFSVSSNGANNVSSVAGAGIFKSFGNCGYFKVYLANSQLIPAGSIIELWGIRA